MIVGRLHLQHQLYNPVSTTLSPLAAVIIPVLPAQTPPTFNVQSPTQHCNSLDNDASPPASDPILNEDAMEIDPSPSRFDDSTVLTRANDSGIDSTLASSPPPAQAPSPGPNERRARALTVLKIQKEAVEIQTATTAYLMEDLEMDDSETGPSEGSRKFGNKFEKSVDKFMELKRKYNGK